MGSLGQKTTTVGTGSLDEGVTGGSFQMQVTAGVIHENWSGDICQAKSFQLPLNTGTITWEGLKCPVAAGSIKVNTDILLSGSLPASLTKSEIKVSASSSTGDKILCIDIKTEPAA